ncbi:receptor-type tyrosine-protein phosphatase R-like [Poecile atricapillus]|uniref:receptor-type tyrosine-protein phosphatase R-like n=1 Tax=Poecile atricapillus TaxID=48891 RepID=UPI002739FCA1|nr:receptor-type tyrosine-protein phosphatase R-like [Poecile atricapillus]
MVKSKPTWRQGIHRSHADVLHNTQEEDYLNLKLKPTHRRSPPRHDQTPETASSALRDWGDTISTVLLQQEPRMLLQLGAEEEITPSHPFSPPPRTCRLNERALSASPIGPCGSPRLLRDPMPRCQTPPHAHPCRRMPLLPIPPAHPAAQARPSPHPAPGGEAGEGGRPPARAALRMRSALPGMLTAGGGGSGTRCGGAARLPSAPLGSPRLPALACSRLAPCGGGRPPASGRSASCSTSAPQVSGGGCGRTAGRAGRRWGPACARRHLLWREAAAARVRRRLPGSGGGCPGPAAAARVRTPPAPEAAGAPVSTADSGGPGRASPALRAPRSGRASAPDREDLAGGYDSEGKSGLPICLLLILFIYLFLDTGCFSGDSDHFLAIHQRKSGKPVFIYHHVESVEKSLDTDSYKDSKQNFHSASHTKISKLHPAIILKSAFPRSVYDPSLNLLAMTGQDLEVENLPIPTRNVIIVTLQMDVNKLNITLLRLFRQGVAAALGLLPQQVHINRLIAKKNCVELFVSPLNSKPGISEALPSEEVLRSLNINILHQSLSQFGITEVSPEKNVLQGQHEADKIWSKEGFYAVVIFLSIFVILVTCLMVLYRLKEKIQLSLRQEKEKKQEIHLSPLPLQTSQTEYKTTNSMVQPQQAPKVINVVVDPQGQCVPELKPPLCASPSPFRMKPVGLQERRGSNVSLTLDMSSLGSVEPFVTVPTPREKVAMEYLQSAGRVLTRQQLRDTVACSHLLQTEFMEIPMNFVDPKEIDIPSHGTKNRYKTILPNPLSRVYLKPKNPSDSLSTYINANYIRGYGGKEKAFIATQGPMINTVNDFWQMVWQEDSPVIVMITKLKEKNEKCVLYWPEKRGIYGKVEVLVNSVQECKNYTVRQLTVKQGNQSHSVKHYWYTSWPDHKTPDSAQPLLQLMLDVEEDRAESPGRGPVIVHCSAGIGRTGCFIATAIGCQQLKEEGVVDALSIVCQLRVDRGGMVQTSEQYEFVHHALSLYESRLSAEAVQ